MIVESLDWSHHWNLLTYFKKFLLFLSNTFLFQPDIGSYLASPWQSIITSTSVKLQITLFTLFSTREYGSGSIFFYVIPLWRLYSLPSSHSYYSNFKNILVIHLHRTWIFVTMNHFGTELFHYHMNYIKKLENHSSTF